MSWVVSVVLVMGYLGGVAVLALPHEVAALPGTTDALGLRLFVASSEVWTSLHSLLLHRESDKYATCTIGSFMQSDG